MTQPTALRLFEVLDTTWPAARIFNAGSWCIREGQGGGQRVSAATLDGPFEPCNINTAEDEMRGLGQRPLFMIRPGEDALDEALSQRGYDVVDPVVLYTAKVADLTEELPVTAAMPSWPPLAIQRELWQAAGIGAARIAVMERAPAPKTALLGRGGDAPTGTGFVAMHGDIAMVHALEVAPDARRGGIGRRLMQAAANWASDMGAVWLALAVTRANDPANALYRALGMNPSATYHYRRAPEVTP